jgi:hypothetical protein
VIGFSSLTLRLAETRQRVVHVTPSRRLRRDEAEDGQVDAMNCVEPDYLYFDVFNVLGHRDILGI